MSELRGATNKSVKQSKETEQRFRAIFDGAFEFIGLLRPDGTVIEANQTALNYIGKAAREVIGRPFWETAWWDGSAEQQERLKAAIAEAATGQFVRFEAQHAGQDGTVDIIDFSLRPAKDATGRVTYIIPEGRRITARKQAEEALRESEEEFRSLFESATVGMAQTDLTSGKFLRANDRFCQITGYSADELLKKSFSAITHPDDRAENWESFQSLARGNVPEYHVEKRYVRKDGRVVWVRIGTALVRDAEGRPIRTNATVEDITERKQAEEDSAVLAAIVSSANDAIISTRDAVIQTWNKGAERLFGWSAAEAIGQPVAMLMPPTHLDEMRDISDRLRRGEPVPHFDTVRQRKDGSPVDVSLAISPVTQGEQVVTASAILRDITDRKLAQAALSASEERWRASEERLQFALAAGGMGTWERDLRTRKSTWDSRMHEMCGFEPGAVDVAVFEAHVHPDDLPAVQRAIDRTLESGAEYRCEFRFLCPDGRTIWLYARGGVRRDANGKPTHLIGINFDITERKQAEHNLRESEARFRLLAENIDQVFWFIELEPERVTYVSPAFEQLWGMSADRLYENPRLWVERVHPEDRSIVEQAFENWVAGHADTYDIEYRILRQGGEVRWINDRGIVIGFRDGRPCKLSGIATDITERRRAEEERREADRRKDEFIATLAHELRNPLAPIRNVISLLQLQGSPDPDVCRARDVISRQIDHLTRLIDDLLDVSRITSDKLELRKERVSLVEIVNLAVESSHPLIDQHHHKLSILLPGEPIYLHADKLRLAQVIMNLLTNAAKYTPEGGRITLSAEHDGAEVAVRVTDNGVGIAPDQLPQIFDMFYQADRSYEQLHGGLGIGLTLARRLVEMHGGQVEAHSAGMNQGSEFVIRVPIRGEQLAPQKEPAGAQTTRGTAQRILVVDDYGESAETLADLLRLEGNQVEIAHDGLKAVDVAEKFRPAVVLLDIGMPKLNGYEAARKIREQPWGKNMVLIAVTGWGQEKDRNRSREAGFNAHLLKPVDYSALSKLIRSHSTGASTDV
ncbi:MAG TPA: PAS domain S-box protein [Candidatus Binatia bacterium]